MNRLRVFIIALIFFSSTTMRTVHNVCTVLLKVYKKLICYLSKIKITVEILWRGYRSTITPYYLHERHSLNPYIIPYDSFGCVLIKYQLFVPPAVSDVQKHVGLKQIFKSHTGLPEKHLGWVLVPLRYRSCFWNGSHITVLNLNFKLLFSVVHEQKIVLFSFFIKTL